MKWQLKTLAVAVLLSWACTGAAEETAFSFGVIAPFHPSRDNTLSLQREIAETDADNLAFVVSHGIKGDRETCSDALYQERRDMLQNAGNGVIVTLTASDWVNCEAPGGKSGAMERLTRLRDLLFNGEFSLGSTRLPLLRQSASPQFRSYSENARWEVGNVLFATINLPGDNNHYLTDAGRNSEFEDRQVANRVWLQRLFRIATYQKMDAIVLFTDGNPLAGKPSGRSRDGFAETRKQLKTLASRFSGRVLIISSRTANRKVAPGKVVWQGNLGRLEVRSGWIKVTVDTTLKPPFSVAPD
jgi:hypothetical protein